MPVEPEQIDEVYLGIEQAIGYLHNEGHVANPAFDDGKKCRGCDALYRLERAIVAYRKRLANANS